MRTATRFSPLWCIPIRVNRMDVQKKMIVTEKTRIEMATVSAGPRSAAAASVLEFPKRQAMRMTVDERRERASIDRANHAPEAESSFVKNMIERE